MIETPRGNIIQTGEHSCRLTWNPNFQDIWQGLYTRAQKYVDSEVLRLSTPLVPICTGMLSKSGQLGTVIGSGRVTWIASYAHDQYYNTANSRPYDPQRGAFWFERMKATNKASITAGARRIAGGGR